MDNSNQDTLTGMGGGYAEPVKGTKSSEPVVYGYPAFYDYTRPAMALLMPVWYTPILWAWGLLADPYMLISSCVLYGMALWGVYWYLFKFPKTLSLTGSTLTLNYRWNTKPRQMWPLVNVTAELRPSSWSIPCKKTLALENMNTGETIIIDIDALQITPWNLIHDLEDRGVQVTLLAQPRGRDPRGQGSGGETGAHDYVP